MRTMPMSKDSGLEHPRNFNSSGDKDFSTSQDNTDRGNMSDPAFEYSASSVESLPSASGSSMCKTVKTFNVITFLKVLKNILTFSECKYLCLMPGLVCLF